MTIKNDQNETFLVQINLKEKNSYKIIKIRLDASFFEIDNSDPDVFYFIEEKIIYSMHFDTKESTFKGIFAARNEDEKELYGAKEFFRSKFELEFVRFDPNMDFFFINEGKTIKMLSTGSFDVKKIFDQQDFDPIDLFYSSDFYYLFR